MKLSQYKYNLPEKVVYCTKCVVSNQRPRIVFDEDGICNACRFWERKDKTIDWNEREKELRDLCDRFRTLPRRADALRQDTRYRRCSQPPDGTGGTPRKPVRTGSGLG